jgi:hypothetical protein
VASLTMQPIYRVLVVRMEVSCNRMQCPESMQCPAMADLSGCSSRMCLCCSLSAVPTEQPVCLM